ncbi:hypothetical protein B4Q13_23300 [Lacticaseibacillus rhamnosus]
MTLADGEPLDLHIFVDRSSVEVFGAKGRIVLTNLVYPNPGSTGLSLSTEGGELEGIRVSVWQLGYVWGQGLP